MGCFVYVFLGTSRDVTLGPTAIMSLLVSFYTFREPAYALLLAFLSGCIQLAMGLLRLGKALPSCCPRGFRLLSWGTEVSWGAFLCIAEYRGGAAPNSAVFCTVAEVLGLQSTDLSYLPEMSRVWGWKADPG